MEESIDKLIYEETDKRLKEMANPNYQFPKRINQFDIWLMCIMAGICLVLIVLCLMGVIK